MDRAARPSRHVVIYGPPAAGKLTVASAFSTRYGYALLDNHLSFDVALRLFEFGTPEFSRLLERSRNLLLESAAEARRDVVSTLVFAHPVDRPFVERMLDLSARGHVATSFVQLRPPRAVVESRVVAESRAETNKIRDVDTLRGVMGSYDLYTPFNPDDLQIDNTDVPAEEVARRIGDQLGLKPADCAF